MSSLEFRSNVMQMLTVVLDEIVAAGTALPSRGTCSPMKVWQRRELADARARHVIGSLARRVLVKHRQASGAVLAQVHQE
jgi:hypothetical protein